MVHRVSAVFFMVSWENKETDAISINVEKRVLIKIEFY
tara:strand:- start:63929 stop:64042 length:114 start_codon:yes stop_codon:yes gene_type:complete